MGSDDSAAPRERGGVPAKQLLALVAAIVTIVLVCRGLLQQQVLAAAAGLGAAPPAFTGFDAVSLPQPLPRSTCDAPRPNGALPHRVAAARRLAHAHHHHRPDHRDVHDDAGAHFIIVLSFTHLPQPPSPPPSLAMQQALLKSAIETLKAPVSERTQERIHLCAVLLTDHLRAFPAMPYNLLCDACRSLAYTPVAPRIRMYVARAGLTTENRDTANVERI